MADKNYGEFSQNSIFLSEPGIFPSPTLTRQLVCVCVCVCVSPYVLLFVGKELCYRDAIEEIIMLNITQKLQPELNKLESDINTILSL